MRNICRSSLLRLLTIFMTLLFVASEAHAGGFVRGPRGGFAAVGPRGGAVVGRSFGGGYARGGWGGGYRRGWSGAGWGPAAAGVGLGLGALAVGAAAAGAYGPGYGYGYVDGGYAPVCYITRRPILDAWGNIVAIRAVRVCE